MSTGILYFLYCAGGRGLRHGLQLFTAIDSLRRVAGCKEQVLICCGNEEAIRTAELISAMDGNGPTAWKPINFRPDIEKCYAAKTQLDEWTEFDQTLYTDTDTLWRKPIHSSLWANDSRIVLTQFSDWVFSGSKTRSRIKKWLPFDRDVVEKAMAPESANLPSVNTGVMSWHRSCDIWRPWRTLCYEDPKHFLGDETSLLAIMPSHMDKWRCVGSSFNWSPIHDKTPIESATLVHLHGQKSFTRTQGQDIWLPYFLDCYRENRLGVRDYLSRHSGLLPELRAISERFGGMRE